MISSSGRGGGGGWRSSHARGTDGRGGRGSGGGRRRQRSKRASGGSPPFELKLQIPPGRKGRVIGERGAVVQAIQQLSETRVRVSKQPSNGQVRVQGTSALRVLHGAALVLHQGGIGEPCDATLYPLRVSGRCTPATRTCPVVIFEPDSEDSFFALAVPLQSGMAWDADPAAAGAVVDTAIDNARFSGTTAEGCDAEAICSSRRTSGDGESTGLDWWLLLAGPRLEDLRALQAQVEALWPSAATAAPREALPEKMVPVSDDPAYAPFFRMLKARVPRPAVEMRMRAAGLDPLLLDFPSSAAPATPSQTSPPPPPSPPQPKAPRDTTVRNRQVEQERLAAATAANIDREHLRAEMEAKSAALLAQDLAEDNEFSKLVFRGLVLRERFEPHDRKKDRDSTDEFFIEDYCRCAVLDEGTVLDALEQAFPFLPSTVLPAHNDVGALYLGGFSSARNVNWLLRKGVKLIVNAARGMELFPDFEELRRRLREGGCGEFVDLQWDDSLTQTIERGALYQALRSIHTARVAGGGVLVHCAAGRSRSATVVLAYLLALHPNELSFERALEKLRQRRHLAKPNDAFLTQLRSMWENGDNFREVLL